MEYVAAPDSARAPTTVADEMKRMRVRREEIMILLGETFSMNLTAYGIGRSALQNRLLTVGATQAATAPHRRT
ncbi:hypothetical protein DDJ66_31865 [Klebsiella oxytoca]|nr:hypothetical protein DDJ66_31865 [Klebsiella oxytoca]